jgi:hypothetical protein
MRSNSSGVRPCSATSLGVTVGSAFDFGIDSETLANLLPVSIEQIRSNIPNPDPV